MIWTPPKDWQDSLRHELSAAAHDAGMTMWAAGAAMGRRDTPPRWFRRSTVTGKIAMPNLRIFVDFCGVVGVSPSEILRRAGL